MLMSRGNKLWKDGILRNTSICMTCGQLYENHYSMSTKSTATLSGSDTLITCKFNDYNDVFTIEEEEDKVYREITILLTTASTKLTLNQ